MSILYGLYRPDEGQILVNGNKVEIDCPSTAIKLGIGMVHQHFMVVPSLTVAENIILGREPTKYKLLLDMKKTLGDVKDFCEHYRLKVDLESPIYTLPVGVQQRVEILKALYRGADILILDEPTSVLTPQEAEELFKAMRVLKDQGKAVIFISHKLREVLAICDRITVLRRGKVVGTVKANETDLGELAGMMVGRKVIFTFRKKQVETKEFVLKVEDLKAVDDRGLPALKGVTFDVMSFEILGVAGVEGNGQTELVETITGVRKTAEGKITLESVDITQASPSKRIELGISTVPEDRHKRGLIMDFSVMENLILGSQNSSQFTKGRIRLNFEAALNYAKRLIKEFSIKTPSTDTLARYLSGGTQQRVIVAREFSRKPKLIVASQPTRGLDVGATEYVRQKLVEMRDQGCAVLLISADLDEIWALSDRIAVIYEGGIVAIREPEKTSERELGLLMAGGMHD
jgi:simple sugar transport system ATP-binding protein